MKYGHNMVNWSSSRLGRAWPNWLSVQRKVAGRCIDSSSGFCISCCNISVMSMGGPQAHINSKPRPRHDCITQKNPQAPRDRTPARTIMRERLVPLDPQTVQPDRVRFDLLQGCSLDCSERDGIGFRVHFPELANKSKTFDRRHRGGLDDLHGVDLRTTRAREVEHHSGVTVVSKNPHKHCSTRIFVGQFASHGGRLRCSQSDNGDR